MQEKLKNDLVHLCKDLEKTKIPSEISSPFKESKQGRVDFNFD